MKSSSSDKKRYKSSTSKTSSWVKRKQTQKPWRPSSGGVVPFAFTSIETYQSEMIKGLLQETDNIEKAKEIILQQFKRLSTINKKDLEEAKTFIEGNHTLNMEDNFHASDNLAFWETIKDASLSKDYLKKINKVSISDVKRVAKKYLNDKYTMAVIEQK